MPANPSYNGQETRTTPAIKMPKKPKKRKKLY